MSEELRAALEDDRTPLELVERAMRALNSGDLEACFHWLDMLLNHAALATPDGPASAEPGPDRADLRDRLDNDIRELRGAEPAEMAQRLLDRGWTLATPDRADTEERAEWIAGWNAHQAWIEREPLAPIDATPDRADLCQNQKHESIGPHYHDAGGVGRPVATPDRADLDADRLWAVLAGIGVLDNGTWVAFTRADADAIVEAYNALTPDRADPPAPARDDVEWLVRYARKQKGPVAEVAQRALDENPGLRPGGWATPDRADLEAQLDYARAEGKMIEAASLEREIARLATPDRADPPFTCPHCGTTWYLATPDRADPDA